MTAPPDAALRIFRYESEEAAASAELRYLAATNLAEARRVFNRVDEVVWRPGAEPPPVPSDLPALIFTGDAIHLGAASLRRMQKQLDADALVVVPETLTAFDLDGETIQTLRGYERLEQRLLDREPSQSERPLEASVALLSPSFLDRRDIDAKALLDDLRPALQACEPDELVRAGVCYPLGDYYGGVREDVVPFVPPEVRDVLDVGCGRGLTGALLQERLGCRVTGVELNPVAARSASERLHRVLVGDVESLRIDETFDAILAIDLFEHLVDPDAFLRAMRPLLRPGGRLVLSVPNVGHYTVVEDLLAGRWDYVPMGLLCVTHLRFFTRATLESWLERAGFSSCEIAAQTTPVPERLERLAEHVELDKESLATLGFYVVGYRGGE